MSKELIVSSTSLETKLAILEDDQVTEIFIERDRKRSILGNIYKGRVTRVLPGMQAAFVDIGLDRNAFLYVSDFFEDYEDYEELFTATDEAVDEFLAEQQEKAPRKRRQRKGKPAPRRDPRERAKSRKQNEVKREEAASTRAKESSDPTQPFLLPAGPQEFECATILPDLLEPPDEKMRYSGIEALSALDQPSILPDSFASGESEPDDRSESSEAASVTFDPDIHLLANNRSSGRSRRRGGNGAPLIGDLLKEGQEILVQIAKEPIGKKGARITSHIVFPGRYLVFMPTVDHVGVSRRIESSKERQRLKDLVIDLRGDIEKGFIVRTAGEGKSREDFRLDMVYLTRLWEHIRAKSEKSTAPALIHSELGLVQRVIRDFFSDDYRAIRVDDEREYERIVEFITNFNPDLVKKVRLYNKDTPIFDDFHINPEIEKALKSKVWLKTGGYIVINQTEALVAIDVNTGKYVGRTNSLEDTIAKTNFDAVKEVARQIRLRDLGGIIVVDFIDMNEPKNQQKVYDGLQQELKKDKSPSKILPFNEFGLVAITRKRVKQSLERTLCQPCSTCGGTGMTKAVRTVCYTIHDEIRRSLPAMGSGNELIIRCHPDVGKALRESESIVVHEIEELIRKDVTIKADPLMQIEQFDFVET